MPAARLIRVIGRQGTAPGELHIPIDVAVDHDDRLIVTDHYNARVQVFSTAGELLAVVPVPLGPGGLALDAEGNWYVTHFPATRLDAARGRDMVTVYRPTGEPLRDWGESGAGEGQFAYPGGLAISPEGEIYVADQSNRRMQVFDLQGRFRRQWGGPGLAPSEFGGEGPPGSRVQGPNFVALDGEGCVFTTEAMPGRIQRFTPAGEPVGEWGHLGDEPGGFGGPFRGFPGTTPSLRGPIGIAVDAGGRVWISSVSGRVQQFEPDGRYLQGVGGEQGTEPGQFYAPHGLAFDRAGNLYVADTFNHRVQVFVVAEG